MTLTQTAKLTKRAIKVFIILVILGIISLVAYRIWYNYYLSKLPPVEEKPDSKFGRLPTLNFPASKASSANFSYSLDTATGGLPEFKKIIRVYFIPKAAATFLAGEKSADLAEKFNIKNPPEILTETRYRFSQEDKNLTIEVDTGNFIYRKEASASSLPSLSIDKEEMVQNFKRILAIRGLLKDELRSSPSKIQFLRFDRNELVSTSQAEAQAAQISIWPADLDKTPIITADLDRSLVNAVVTKRGNELDDYLTLNFTFWTIDTAEFATYPLKTTALAFEELKSGKGVIMAEPQKSQVSITSVYLAYFQSDSYSPYLQPIFVFEGPGFAAFVPAVSDQFLSPAS